jgi:hypothetical protein
MGLWRINVPEIKDIPIKPRRINPHFSELKNCMNLSKLE